MPVKKNITKAQYAADIFTTEQEARARSMDLGLMGKIHVHEYDGQAVYMPGSSHEEYLDFYEPEDSETEEPYSERLEALRVVIQEIMKEDIVKAEYQGKEVTLNKPRRIKGGNKKFEVFVRDGDKVKRVTFGDPNMEIRRDDPKARASFRARHNCDQQKDKTSAAYWSCRMWEEGTTVSEATKGEIFKINDEQRMVYGWASVISEDGIPVKDRQGDIVEAPTLESAVNKFMETVRVGKKMHSGEQIGVIVHSFPLTNDIAKSIGIETNREGWIIGMKVNDEETWNRVKKGELRAFSIGGRGQRKEV